MNMLTNIQKCVNEFIESCREEDIELHSILVGDSKRVWLKGYWDPYKEENRHILFSVSKSFACIALGLLFDDGLVDLEKPLIEYFPEYAHLTKGHMNEVTLHHILTMNAGTDDFTTSKVCTHGIQDDWAANFFSDQLVHKPGTYYQYNTPGSYMICRTVMKLCGKRPLDLLNERIFWPMDIRDVGWDECPLGCNTGGWGMWMRPMDLLKIGQLFLKQGCWNGKQLLSKSWIERMNHPYSDTSRLESPTDKGYGYQIWMNTSGGYSFRGMFGQFCYILPEKDCVLVITSGTHQKEKQGILVEKLAAELGSLHNLIREDEPYVMTDLTLPPLPVEQEVPDSSRPYVQYNMETNEEGYESVGFYLGKESGYLHLNYNESQGRYQNVVPFGYGRWQYGTRTCKGQISFWTGGTRKVAISGSFKDDQLYLLLRFCESSNAEYWRCEFNENRVTIHRHLNCGDHGDISMETLKGAY